MFPEHPVHDLADLRREATDLCASLRERIAETGGGPDGDLPAPEQYAALSLAEISSSHYNRLPEELLAASSEIAAKKSDLLPLYNRFMLAWLILSSDPSRSALQLPWSILALYPVHFARILRQMERLADEAYDLSTDAYVKDLATLLFRLVPFGESSMDVHRGPTRRILTGDGPLQALRALWALYRLRGRGPMVVAHNHLLSLGERNDRSYITGHHRLADIVAANTHLKGLAGNSWMVDPALEFVTPHHSMRWRVTIRNGGSIFRLGRDEASTAHALANSRTRRQLYEEGKYVPTNYLRLWPRDAMVAWSRRSRLASWGEVGMESRVPPAQYYGRNRHGHLLDGPTGAATPRVAPEDSRSAADELCESLRKRISGFAGAQDDAIEPEQYAALALPKTPTATYREPPPEMLLAESTIASTRPELVAAYNRFALAWLITNADPRHETLRIPTSIRSVVLVHAARILRQMTTLEDAHYSLESDEFLKDLAVLSSRLIPLGELSVEVSDGPGRSELAKYRPVSFVQLLRVLRVAARGLTPVYQAHTHVLAGGEMGKDYVDSMHRLADLAAANPGVKAMVGEGWMEDPGLEFITPHHSLRGRFATANGGALLRIGRDETSTALALKTSVTRRQLFDEGKYVPTSYMRIWPREGIVRWSKRTRPASWGPVGMDSRVPPPNWLGRRRKG